MQNAFVENVLKQYVFLQSIFIEIAFEHYVFIQSIFNRKCIWAICVYSKYIYKNAFIWSLKMDLIKIDLVNWNLYIKWKWKN